MRLSNATAYTMADNPPDGGFGNNAQRSVQATSGRLPGLLYDIEAGKPPPDGPDREISGKPQTYREGDDRPEPPADRLQIGLSTAN
jgi:hypothetical protein